MTAFLLRIGDWSSDVCSSDLPYRPPESADWDRQSPLWRQRNPRHGRPHRVLQHHSSASPACGATSGRRGCRLRCSSVTIRDARTPHSCCKNLRIGAIALRSEETTSELQSLMRITYAVFRVKKKINNT